MQKITPHLWFDKEARESAEFYVSAFPNSKVKSIKTITNTPSGDCDIVSYELNGYSFMSISAGPTFKPNPSISFMVNFDPSRDSNAKQNLDNLWSVLSLGGFIMMPLQKYDFSEYYGWVQDKYGVSWQLILTNPDGEERPFIVPSLMYTNKVYGKAEEATDFYISIFKNSKRGIIARYPAGMDPDEEGNIMFTDFMLEGQWFASMESAREHTFSFNEGISLIVYCDNQEEIDYYWEKLTDGGEEQPCGWLKDKYGVSWQIVPRDLDEIMSNGNQEQIDRVTQAFLQMKKFDIQKLKEASGK